MDADDIGRLDQRDESVLVAIEAGGRWPQRLDACSHGHAAVVVVIQGPTEIPARFARRCLARLEQLDVSHYALSQVVVVVGSAMGAEALVARTGIARVILKRMAAEPGAALSFVVPARFPDEARHAILALVATLVQATDTLVSIRAVVTEPDAPADDVGEPQAW